MRKLKLFLFPVALLLLTSTLVVLLTPGTNAAFSDQEISNNSALQATKVDIGLSAPASQSALLVPGSTVTQDVLLTDFGSVPFNYKLSVASPSADPLCDALQLEVTRQVYNPGLIETTLFSGLLPDFSGFATPFAYPDSPYIANPDYNTNQHWYQLQFSLPFDAPQSLALQQCDYTLEAVAWQQPFTTPQGFSDSESIALSLQTDEWQQCQQIAGTVTNSETEEGLATWPVAVLRPDQIPVETITVDASNSSATASTTSLTNDHVYLIEVTGTWMNNNLAVDADYRSSDNWVSITDLDEDSGRDPEQLDLLINDQDIDWGNYNDDHRYKTVIIGQDQPLSFLIYDKDNDPNPPNWYNDNSGSLTVEIYDVTVNLTNTLADGSYSIEACEAGVYQVLPLLNDVFTQVHPEEGPSYYHLNNPTNEEDQSADFDLQPTIVLNEILADPLASDSASMPDGEWIEIYNRSELATVDLDNWYLENNLSSQLEISADNADANANPFDAGETEIDPQAELVVYRDGASFELNNSTETISLYDPDGRLIDRFSYDQAKVEGNSWARVPNGGSWVDPLPTPGRRNLSNPFDLEPSIVLGQFDLHHAWLGLFDYANYDSATYYVSYLRDQDGQAVQEVSPSQTINLEGNTFYDSNIFMGTMSGENQYPHQVLGQLELHVTLSGAGLPDRNLTFELDTWSSNDE